MTVIPACLIVVSALLVSWRRSAAVRRRLSRLPGVAPPRRTRRPHPVRWIPVLVAISVSVVIEGWFGVAAGIATGIVLDRVLRRRESRSAREDRLAAAADLPFAIDLMAASLRAGTPPAAVTQTVGVALGGTLGNRLCRVAHALELGASPVDAWAHLHGVPGARRVTVAAVRSSESGAGLASALARLADELRTARVTACEAAARRAGVLVVLPLGLCFLPAFVLAGLVPIVLSVLGEVIR